MAINTTLESLSTTAASNGPAGTDQRTLADDGLRQYAAFIKQLVSLATLASGSTVTPPSTAKVFSVTGTTTINTIASTNSWDGREITFIFAGILTLTHSSNLALPGSANITTAANDIALFVQTASGAWRCSAYLRASGGLTPNGAILTTSGTVSLPGIGIGETDSGFYRVANDVLAATCGATEVFRMRGTPALAINSILSSIPTFLVDRFGTSTTPSAGHTTGTVASFLGNTAAGSPAYISVVAGNTSLSGINFGDTDADSRGYIRYNHSLELLALATANTIRVTVDDQGRTTFNAPDSAVATILVDQFAGATAAVQSAQSLGGQVLNWVLSNLSNTASSEARLGITVAGGTAADPNIGFTITGVTAWTIGADNSDSDTFKVSKNGSLGTNDYLNVTTDGRVFGTALHNNAGAMTGATNQYVGSGTYTPTVTNVLNTDARAGAASIWTRVGNVVQVSGQMTVDPIAAATTTQVGISLPIASNFGATTDCAGFGSRPTGTANFPVGIIQADTTNDRADMTFISAAGDTANNFVFFQFQYVVI